MSTLGSFSNENTIVLSGTPKYVINKVPKNPFNYKWKAKTKTMIQVQCTTQESDSIQSREN
jgi:hypothetical protein